MIRSRPGALAAIVLLSAAPAAFADEAAVRRMIQQRFGGSDRIESVQKAPWSGLYEVVLSGADGPQIIYVDEAASVLIVGRVFDARTGRNLTEERERQLTAIQWDKLPWQWAITSKRGTARRKIAILSDPNCPYCKRLEEDLAKLDDITTHIFPYAVIKPESVRQAKAVWCSKDRVKAWNDLMFRRIEPQASIDCDNPIERLIEFGGGIGARSTPTWFLENGERYSGAMPLEKVRALLDAASPAKR
ncbi:MAG: DsbC family protein [Betaproteobacteria bacterium]|nr:DsbC family protein [Betaproteobacteria bacterium]